jgi:enoyl-CoA hydratase/carnithine racemase
MMLSIQKLPVPVIARVQGIATAAGCQLVAQCDLAVASSEARFATSGIQYGLFCSTPSVPLVRNMPIKQSMEMLLTGEFIDAQTALHYGLLNRVVEPERLDAAVEELVSAIVSKPRWPSEWARNWSIASVKWAWSRPISWRARPWPPICWMPTRRKALRLLHKSASLGWS